MLDMATPAKPLSWDEIRKNAAAFVHEWKGETYERGESQSFWTDLFQVFGVRRRSVAKFEDRAKKVTRGVGYMDVFWPGVMIGEHKSAGKDLLEAEDQAMAYITYMSDVETPRFVVTCNFERFRVRDLEADPGSEPAEFDLADLPRECEQLGFIAGYQRRVFGSHQQEKASIQAAQLMAGLYEELEKAGYDEHQASVFLVRTLFALYADDSGLWERDLFLEFVETRTGEDGSDLGAQLATLYQNLNKRPNQRLRTLDEMIQRFPYVNGDIFGDPIDIPSFDRAMREKLIEACLFDWNEISPAIFGSLFQSVKSKAARRQLGEHYTTERNIMRVVGPLFLDELHQRFAEAQRDVKALEKLHRDMGKMRFLDPACGCGNFLVVAYREMRSLELQVLQRLQEIDPRRAQTALLVSDLLEVKLQHFFGIELEEWPATIARTAMHLVNHQANQDMALALTLAPDPLPLIDTSTIKNDNALTSDWESVLAPSPDVIVLGNPPFKGHRGRQESQAAELRTAWKRHDIGRLDYVTGWYAKTLEYFADITTGGRWAFVSTNSITQGEPVPALFQPVVTAGWRIRFAHRTFKWTSEAPDAAAVHCVIVGFDRTTAPAPRLFVYDDLRGEPQQVPAKHINAYLVDLDDIWVEQRRVPLSPALPKVVFGNMPRDDGNLIVETEDYPAVMADPVAAKYVHRFVGAKQLIHGLPRWCLWLVDLDPADVSKSPILKERLAKVRDFRAKSTAESTRQMAQTPQLFGQRSQPTTDYLCIPRHVSVDRLYFPVDHLTPDVIVGDSNFEAPDPDGYLFAVFSSSMFLTWQRTVGGAIKSDLRFSNTIVWNNFPLPQVNDRQRAAVIAAGQHILEVRARHPERSLAEHYNPLAMEPELLAAHHALDLVVDKIFTRASMVDELARQRVLLQQYAKRNEEGKLPAPSRTRNI